MKKDSASSNTTPRQSRSNVVPLKGEIDLHVSPTVTATFNDVIEKKPERRLWRQIHAGRIAGNGPLDFRNLAARSGLSDFSGRRCRSGWLM
jgi:hypothetical protein